MLNSQYTAATSRQSATPVFSLFSWRRMVGATSATTGKGNFVHLVL